MMSDLVCPACEALLPVDLPVEPRTGDLRSCPECGELFIVTDAGEVFIPIEPW